MKKLLLVFLMSISMIINTYGAQPENIGATGAVLMDMETGRVLWEKNSDVPLSVASTTKIMTALLAIESGLLEETATVSARAAKAPKTKLGVSVDDEYILNDLLYPLMLESSNDVAIVIAEHVGGSVEEFAIMMNERAEEIGAIDTYFVTPNGLDENNNHSTAYDMALITAEALKNQDFVNLINTKTYSFQCQNKSKNFSVTNKNRLLSEYEGALGVKTGFTNLAGQCFVGGAERDGMTLISVVLASGWGSVGKQKKWTDTKSILNYGFDNYSLEQVLDKTTLWGKTIVNHSEEDVVKALIEEDGYAVLSQDEKSDVKVKAKLIESIDAPVKKGDVLGSVWVETLEGEVIFETNMIAEKDIERKTMRTSLQKVINNWLNSSFAGIIDTDEL